MAAIPQLPFDIISNILQIRMENKKDDRYKNNFNAIVKNINDINILRQGISTYCVEFPNDFEHDSTSRLQEIPRYHNGVFMIERIKNK